MDAVRFNEKVKRASTIFGAGGITQLVATLFRWGDDRFTIAIAGWILTSCVAMLASVQMNELLRPEDEV